jgi:fatty-acid peroxygenase
MSDIPYDRRIDSTFALLRGGYRFIQSTSRELRSDIFWTRLAFQKMICVTGPHAARLFYDNDKCARSGVIPRRIEQTLFGRGGVQGLDGAEHHCRKAMFMSLMTRQGIEAFKSEVIAEWMRRLASWERSQSVCLFREAQTILCVAACRWLGIPLADAEAERRAKDLAAMVDGFGGVGPRHWRGRLARLRSEHWMRGVIAEARSGKPTAGGLHTVAFHRDRDGELLDIHIAAVEALNLVRPIVAIAYFAAFIALALHRHPQERLNARHFIEEVRRFFPFTPFVGARTRREIEWGDYRLPVGEILVLDIYGIDRDARLWDRPETFWPGRFANWTDTSFDLIPQGGGDPTLGHRCAGELLTVQTMDAVLRLLTEAMEYRVPSQDLGFSLARIPTYPRSGFVMTNIRRKEGF